MLTPAVTPRATGASLQTGRLRVKTCVLKSQSGLNINNNESAVTFRGGERGGARGIPLVVYGHSLFLLQYQVVGHDSLQRLIGLLQVVYTHKSHDSIVCVCVSRGRAVGGWKCCEVTLIPEPTGFNIERTEIFSCLFTTIMFK